MRYSFAARVTHPLAYPVGVSVAAGIGCSGLLPFADADQQAALIVVVASIIGGSGYRLGYAVRGSRPSGAARYVRQQYRLTSRSWLEAGDAWQPGYFEPGLALGTAERIYPAGRPTRREPIGRLIDMPRPPGPDVVERVTRATRWRRRLLLDSQSAVAAPFVGIFWIYLAGGGLTAYVGTVAVAAFVAIWLTAIRGSDPL